MTTSRDLKALRSRAIAAVARAAASAADSERLVSEAKERRDHQYVLSCAWCGRYLVDGEYVDRPGHRPFHVSHGICPECVAELKRTGRSR